MARNLKGPLAGCFACIAGLAMTALLAFGTWAGQRLDYDTSARFITASDGWVESLANGLTLLGDLPALLSMLAIACAIGWARGRPRGIAAAVVVVAGAGLTTQLLKVALSHPRARHLLGAENVAWDGFPSGHVTAQASIAIAFAFVVPRRFLAIVAAVGAFLVVAMGCAVLVLDWHDLSDVAGGVLVAGAWGFAVLASLRFAPEAPGGRPAQLRSRAAISLK